MKHFLSAFIALIFIYSSVVGQEKKLLSPKAVAEGEHIEITYGQPSKRGRVIFGNLVPYDSVWRTGANEATEIVFQKDCELAGEFIKAGRYTLFTIPSKDSWLIIINAQLGQWGAYEYEKYKLKDLLKASVPSYRLKYTAEKLVYTINASSVRIEWDDTGVCIPYRIINP